ncbi:MAG: class II fumarate hydratase [Candidatus Borkfalkiaceae bacterium]|nr:class II fumarate hydratase [Christensenellaceae bacterium]
MDTRTEKDCLGEIEVPSERLWGAQTERSFENFKIGSEKMPREIIRAFALLKKAAAEANLFLKKISKEKAEAIKSACDYILNGGLNNEFPLSVWQTGSGTQTNMNVNEVIANFTNKLTNRNLLHPNDDVNMSQSSNDTFPTALHIAAILSVTEKLLPAVDKLIDTLKVLRDENMDVLKCGRTHLQDAVPLTFGQEISGWVSALTLDRENIDHTLSGLYSLAVGGTAVGTGLNAPQEFGSVTSAIISQYTDRPFRSADNKFQALSFRNDITFSHGAIKTLACDLMKIANDVRWLASGPRNGLGEITIPANEPGSSIMPGKVNPTQCEAVTMVCVQVVGNDTSISFADSQGNFQLNVYLPVIAYNYLQSVNLLSDAIISFEKNCVSGIKPVKAKMAENVEKSLMLVTALNPYIGYENSAKVAKYALENNKTLKQACAELGFFNSDTFDRICRPEDMVNKK